MLHYYNYLTSVIGVLRNSGRGVDPLKLSLEPTTRWSKFESTPRSWTPQVMPSGRCSLGSSKLVKLDGRRD